MNEYSQALEKENKRLREALEKILEKTKGRKLNFVFPITQIASDALNYKSATPIEEQPGDGYWKQRCEAAEKVIQCIPDRPENLYELGFKQAMNNWKELKNNQP